MKQVGWGWAKGEVGNGEGSEVGCAGGIKSILDRLSRRGPWDRPWDRMVTAWPAARPWGIGSAIWTSSGSLRMINLNWNDSSSPTAPASTRFSQ